MEVIPWNARLDHFCSVSTQLTICFCYKNELSIITSDSQGLAKLILLKMIKFAHLCFLV